MRFLTESLQGKQISLAGANGDCKGAIDKGQGGRYERRLLCFGMPEKLVEELLAGGQDELKILSLSMDFKMESYEF